MNRRQFGKLVASTAAAQALPSLPALSSDLSGGPKFSVMLWALEKQAPFDRCLEITAQASYQGVELVGEFHKWQPAETHSTMDRLRSLKLTVDSMSGVMAGFAVPEEGPAFLTQFANQVRWAKDLECPQIILLSGKRVDSISPAAQRQAAVDMLKRASDTAAENRLEIVIEPIDLLENPSIFLSSVSDGFEIVRAANRPNVKVLYDIYHEQRSFGNLLEKLENNIDSIGLIHVADVPGRHEPGTGEIDYGTIYRKLAQLHYSRFIAMEFYPTQDPVVSLRKARETALQAMAS